MPKFRFLNQGKPPEDNSYTHIRPEPDYVLEARDIRAIREEVNASKHISPETRAKLEKVLNVASLDTLNKIRDAYAKGLEDLTGNASPE